MTLSNQDNQYRTLQDTARRINMSHAMEDDHFCWGCESWHSCDALETKSEMLVATDSRSRIDYWVCPDCGSDELQRIDEELVLEFLGDLARTPSATQKRKYREVRHDIIKEWIECA